MNQKKVEITYRELKKEDYPAIERIICDTWGYERRSEDKKSAQNAAKANLMSCLSRHNFARVALWNGKVAGVIIGRCSGKPGKGFSAGLSLAWTSLKLLVRQEGRAYLKRFRELKKADSRLLSGSKDSYQGEILLLAVARGKRGKGIGTELWNTLKQAFQESRAEKICVFTDSACDYKFYEQQEFQKKNTGEQVLDLSGQRVKLQTYLYEYICQ